MFPPPRNRQIAASIETFGFTNPVLIDQHGTILAGHGRVEAAKSLGMGAVPCLRIEHMTEDEKRAYVIADNKLALNAGWDEELLAQELQGLLATEALGFDIGVSKTPITPVIVGKGELAHRLSDRLFEEGVFAQGIGYPTVPEARSRVRTIVTAAHTRENLDTAIATFEKVGRELGII